MKTKRLVQGALNPKANAMVIDIQESLIKKIVKSSIDVPLMLYLRRVNAGS